MFADELEAGPVVDFVVNVAPAYVVDGWAITSDRRCWAYMSCRVEHKTIAYDIAKRFNQEAMEQGLGYGWCGYSLDLLGSWDLVRGKTIQVACVKSGQILFEYDVPYEETDDVAQRRPHLVRTVVEIDVGQLLHSTDNALAEFNFETLGLYVHKFIANYGPREFVSRAYEYLLERPADTQGFENYVRALEEGLVPTHILTALYHSNERRMKPRQPIALPGDAQFPFYPE
jgi:hypothetical protein